jgi:2,4-dienoyl-CoA reductase-like NADH-dependent reductase (Old Yellow Enzyme family)
MNYHGPMPRQPHLFTPLTLRGFTFRNRIVVSPMCQYSATDGLANDWHLVHLGSRAVGGAGLVIVEATGVVPEGRISSSDLGLWSDAHVAPLARIVRFVKEQGAAVGIQLAHAGRKASTSAPWEGGRALSAADGGWEPVAPSAIPFADGFAVPRALSDGELGRLVDGFGAAAHRARAAGFDVIELHAAHGYLLHQFLSPLSNHRDDGFGGSYENRVRFPLMVARRLREAWPDALPLFVRISATDWVDGGWSLDDSVEFARRLKAIGVDLVDCSSGGLVMDAKIPTGPGYQTPLAAAVRKDAGVATGAVGLVTSAEQAEQILATGQADVVLLARELLRNPYWPLAAARKLGAAIDWPKQYLRAKV